MMLRTIEVYIKKNDLLQEGNSPVLVGLSGGADSVALLKVLIRLGYRCIALHCNFHLRGEESDRDEMFARKVAEQLGISFFVKDFNTVGYAQEKHISIEMAARELRYAWFEEQRQERGGQAIAVAHHRDDSVETLLMNLMRGTGIRGMTGIRPKNGHIVRPLLAVSREDIIQWLETEQQDYVTDSTNLSDAYARNFIRLRILPLMKELNPAVKETIARSVEHLGDVEDIYLRFIEEVRRQAVTSDHRIHIDILLQQPAAETVLYELLKSYDFNRIVALEIFQSLGGEPGRIFYSSSWRLVKDREYLLLSPLNPAVLPTHYIINTPEEINTLPVELSASRFVLSKEFSFEKDKKIACFDWDKLRFPLTLRRWQKGDWFIPFGMKGKKKLSDYFSDHKYSLLQKEEAWLLCSGNDVIWLVGERVDDRFRVEKTTKEVLILKKRG